MDQSTDTKPSSTEDPDSAVVDALDFRHQYGTKSHPYITFADPSYPERNFPFEITSIEGVAHNNFEYRGFHIRLCIALPDIHEYKAFIPSSKEYPKLAPLIGRVVMVKGPSRPYWMTDAELYHDREKRAKGVNCQVTKTAHEMTDTAIKWDLNRQTSFFLIVFQKGIILENYIFSDNSTNLQMSKNGMQLAPEHPKNPFTKVDSETKKKKFDVIGVCVWWRIGIAGGKRIGYGDAKEDLDDLFA